MYGWQNPSRLRRAERDTLKSGRSLYPAGQDAAGQES